LLIYIIYIKVHKNVDKLYMLRIKKRKIVNYPFQ